MAATVKRSYSIASIKAAIEDHSARNLARLFPSKHFDPADPTRTSTGVKADASSRFSDPKCRYGVLYASPDVGTGVWEALIRDRYIDEVPTLLDAEVEARTVVFFDSPSLLLVRLDVQSIREIKTSRDSIGGDRHDEGQRLSAFVHDNALEADGFMYHSTFTEQWCVALFERATPKLQFVRANALSEQPEVDQLCAEYGISRVPQ